MPKLERFGRVSVIVGFILVLFAAAILAGCQGAEHRDLENIKIKDPAKIEIYANINGHPNLVRQCVDGLAFVTTTRDLQAIFRVPEWDGWCRS